MKVENKKHSYHLVEGENNGWNSYYESMITDSVITVQDFEFIKENCKLSKSDIKLFLSKKIDVEFMSKDDKKIKKCNLWYEEFIKRVGRLPKLNDYYDFENIIESF